MSYFCEKHSIHSSHRPGTCYGRRTTASVKVSAPQVHKSSLQVLLVNEQRVRVHARGLAHWSLRSLCVCVCFLWVACCPLGTARTSFGFCGNANFPACTLGRVIAQTVANITRLSHRLALFSHLDALPSTLFHRTCTNKVLPIWWWFPI